jgi:hypothetical protein
MSFSNNLTRKGDFLNQLRMATRQCDMMELWSSGPIDLKNRIFTIGYHWRPSGEEDCTFEHWQYAFLLIPLPLCEQEHCSNSCPFRTANDSFEGAPLVHDAVQEAYGISDALASVAELFSHQFKQGIFGSLSFVEVPNPLEDVNYVWVFLNIILHESKVWFSAEIVLESRRWSCFMGLLDEMKGGRTIGRELS